MEILFKPLKVLLSKMRCDLKEYYFVNFLEKGCYIDYCSVCKLDQKVRKVTVRGLCSFSLFESYYIATMNQKGNILFLGTISSSISFNKDALQWEWFDQKRVGSVATRNLFSFGSIHKSSMMTQKSDFILTTS